MGAGCFFGLTAFTGRQQLNSIEAMANGTAIAVVNDWKSLKQAYDFSIFIDIHVHKSRLAW